MSYVWGVRFKLDSPIDINTIRQIIKEYSFVMQYDTYIKQYNYLALQTTPGSFDIICIVKASFIS